MRGSRRRSHHSRCILRFGFNLFSCVSTTGVVMRRGRGPGSTQACGVLGHWMNNEVRVVVDLKVAHFSDSVTIRVTSTVTTGLWWTGTPSWGMNDFVLSTAIPYPSAPAPPLAPGVWTSLAHEAWPGASGWVGDPDLSLTGAVTHCFQLGKSGASPTYNSIAWSTY
eukprot:1004721-Prymnesium_polylepis.1